MGTARFAASQREAGTILALPPGLDGAGEPLLPDGAVPFPRGFGFGDGGQLYLSSPTGTFLGVVAELRKLIGQAVLLLQ